MKPYLEPATRPLYPDLAPGKHLLLDHAVVADSYKLKHWVHQPRRDPREPVFVAEHDWEGDYVTPINVVYDEERGRYRMWYQAHDVKLEEVRRQLGKSKYGNVGEPQPVYCCYAESDDGLRWVRPDLGLFAHPAGANSICFKGFSNAGGNTILYQPDAPPEQRYVLTNCDWFSETSGGVSFAYSPDGLHWQYDDEKPVIFGESDTWNSVIYNAERGVYMLYMRGWHCAAVNWPVLNKDNPRRRVAYSESRDLHTWTEPQIIITPDDLDTNDFYGFQVFRYADYYLGMLWIYDSDDEDDFDIELVYSRDGFNWQRFAHRHLFLPHGRRGEDDGYLVIPAQAPVQVGNDLYLYCTGHPSPHDYGLAYRAAAYRTRLRLDGFVSLHAGRHPGALITRPFTLQSDSITINAATYGGEIKYELTEPYYHEVEGKPIAGFSAAECDNFEGDDIAYRLSWRGSTDLSALRGKRLMLRMQLRHADIYSITV